MSEAKLTGADAIVSHIEVNDRHGTGVLLKRIFGECPNVVSIRSQEFYGGDQQFGAKQVRLAHEGNSRDLVFWRMLEALGGSTVARIVCVPYYPNDVLNAIALRDIFDARLCTYLMDDQNLWCDGIPDALISELLEKSRLRIAISKEMAAAYEEKFGRKFCVVPPVAPRQFLPRQVKYAAPDSLRSGEAVIIGNIWGKRWVDLLRQTVRGAGLTVHWYSSRGEPAQFADEELRRDGILVHERRGDADLMRILGRFAFSVVPSGTLDEMDDHRFISQLSLPSRIPYTMATSHTPMIVLGSPDTVAARFVTRSGIGLTAPYHRQAFQKAVAQITDRETNRKMREAAFALSAKFSDEGVAEWIWKSIELGAPVDTRFETCSL